MRTIKALKIHENIYFKGNPSRRRKNLRPSRNTITHKNMYVSTNTLCWVLRFPEMHYYSKYKKRTARGERDRQITKYTPN